MLPAMRNQLDCPTCKLQGVMTADSLRLILKNSL